jgi:7-keto-8-aminopelargonate synthetase-like enzyme
VKRLLDDCFKRAQEFSSSNLFPRLNCDSMTGVPGRYITLMDRVSYDNNETFQFTGTYTTTLNMSSYNYLGFAQSSGPCADDVHTCIFTYGISSTSPHLEVGSSDLPVEVEREIANFVGKEDAMVFSMGFSTNATSFAALVGPGCLIVSDELNHASIRVGARLRDTNIMICMIWRKYLGNKFVISSRGRTSRGRRSCCLWGVVLDGGDHCRFTWFGSS